MTRHPIEAFLRRGKPIPLTGNDFTIRFNGGDDIDARRHAMEILRYKGFVSETKKDEARIYELTEAGIAYARSVLCIPEGRA